MVFESQLLEFSDIQLIDGDRGKNYPKHDDFINSGDCLFLSAKNVTPNGFEFSDTIFINKEKDAQLRAGKLELGDIVVTTRGTIGNVALYDETVGFEHIRINSGMMIFRANPEVWNYRFLYFILTSGFIRKQIETLTSGSAVPQLPAKDLKKFKLPKVSKDIQDVIADNVGTLVDKITLNRQINQTLEQMAQTLFKSWFVDFDPVIDNALDAGNEIPDTLQERAEQRHLLRAKADFKPLPAETRALFPSEFEETELGWVPKGWAITRLENILELAYGKALKKTDRIAGKFPVYGSGGIDGTHNESLVKGPGIIVGRKGTVGSLHWEYDDFYPIDTVFYVKPKQGYSLDFCFQLLKTLKLENMNTDAAVPGLNRNNAYRLECIAPNNTILEFFSENVGKYQTRISFCLSEINSLAQLRDRLIPKLISGELVLDALPEVPELAEAF